MEIAIVPDDMQAIQSKLKEWAKATKLDLILTMGGTVFSPRDVTLE
jgi:molybdopterin biosynthesis enzyme MoaB